MVNNVLSDRSGRSASGPSTPDQTRFLTSRWERVLFCPVTAQAASPLLQRKRTGLLDIRPPSGARFLSSLSVCRQQTWNRERQMKAGTLRSFWFGSGRTDRIQTDVQARTENLLFVFFVILRHFLKLLVVPTVLPPVCSAFAGERTGLLFLLN